MGTILQAVVSLAVVLGIIVLLARSARSRRLGLAGNSGSGAVKVVQRVALAPKAALYVVDTVAGRLLVGATTGAINLLAELPSPSGEGSVDVIDLSGVQDPESTLADAWGRRQAFKRESLYQGLVRLARSARS